MYYGLNPDDTPDKQSWKPGDVLTTRLHPESGKFAPHAFDKQIGKVVPFNYEGKRLGSVKVRSAVVAQDGSYVDLEYEVV